MKNTLRAFFAFPLSNHLHHQIKKALEPLQLELHDKVRWTLENHWHLTIKFLGNIDILQIEELTKKVQELSLTYEPFNLKLTKIAGFPPQKRRPRLITAYVEINDQLLSFAQQLDEIAYMIGIPKERRSFLPHITLARPKTWRVPLFSEIPLNESEIISEMILFESRPARKESLYFPLKKFSFNSNYSP